MGQERDTDRFVHQLQVVSSRAISYERQAGAAVIDQEVDRFVREQFRYGDAVG